MTRAGRIAALVVAVALAGLAGASVARADAVVTVPSDIVAEAQGPSGAQVTYEASAKESETETDLPISCTNPDGSKCSGHSSATGLRTYFDAVSRAARFSATFQP